MRLFDSAELFSQVTAGGRKWERTLEAIRTAPSLLPGVTHSIGDSLTYRRGRASEFATDALVGRRRYHLVVSPVAGSAQLEIASQSDLDAAGQYDDLSDRQLFRGGGRAVTVPSGGILVLDIEEAARILPTDSELVVLHVTVEGATFHNK